jgi:hypothetical protein
LATVYSVVELVVGEREPLVGGDVDENRIKNLEIIKATPDG